MRTVEILGFAIRPTVLGYGCSALMGRGRQHARRLLEAAFDAGIRHFDVAPLYGRGDAEWELGEFARAHRHEISLTTKIGLPPRKLNRLRRGAVSIARQASRLCPSLKSIGGKIIPDNPANSGSATAIKFSVTEARLSLERSLRALRTDSIDLLLLHEYVAAGADGEDTLTFLEDAVRAGKIARFGLGSDFRRTLVTFRYAPRLCGIMQFESSALVQNITTARDLAPASVIITHGALSDSYRRIIEVINHNKKKAGELAKKIDVNVLDGRFLSLLMLGSALIANSDGIVLFSSREPSNIINNARAVDDGFSYDQIKEFERWLEDVRSNW
jgi:D-threo-aldose 1-dehydrogenase